MKSRRGPARWMRGLVAAALLVAAVPMARAGSALAPQVNREGAVTVKVTPGKFAPVPATWDFEVVFDTHTAALTGDPAQFAVLVDAQGRTHAPLRWDGDPPGSHHRKGTLRFRAPEARSGSIELRLNGVGGVATRSFRWDVR